MDISHVPLQDDVYCSQQHQRQPLHLHFLISFPRGNGIMPLRHLSSAVSVIGDHIGLLSNRFAVFAGDLNVLASDPRIQQTFTLQQFQDTFQNFQISFQQASNRLADFSNSFRHLSDTTRHFANTVRYFAFGVLFIAFFWVLTGLSFRQAIFWVVVIVWAIQGYPIADPRISKSSTVEPCFCRYTNLSREQAFTAVQDLLKPFLLNALTPLE